MVTGTYADGSTKIETPESYTVSGYDPSTLGPQTVQVTLNGKSTTFSVKVEPKNISVTIGLPNTIDQQPEIFGIPDGGIKLSKARTGICRMKSLSALRER
jgi:hypothetical protein